MWTLYRQKVQERVYHYVWVSPDGIIAHSRAIAPLGWHCAIGSYVGGNKSALKAKDGWRKVSTKMTQEQLSKGWLV